MFVLAVYKLSTDILAHLNGIKGDEIETNIRLWPIDLVPFPAIIISSGEPIDPLGYVRNSHNIVNASEIKEEGKSERIICCYG